MPLAEARAAGPRRRRSPERHRARYLDAIAALALRPSARSAISASSTRRCTASATSLARKALARGRLHRRHLGARAGRARRRLPHGRLPEPRGEGRDRPLARARARSAAPSSILANDPDADRLAVAVPRAASADELPCSSPATRSACCSATTCSRAARSAEQARSSSPRSSRRPMLGVIARALGVALRGDAHRLQVDRQPRDGARAQGRRLRFVFGYEEALGYTVGDVVRDKDGISAALRLRRARRARSPPRAARCTTSSRRSRASSACS